MHVSFKIVLLRSVAAWFIGSSALQAQEYAFRSFTVHDGAVSNYITTLKQDSKGYLWIGTDEGFSIFDGTTFQNIRPPKQPTWGQINSFCESRIDPEVMWVGTNGGGILRYSKGTYRSIMVDTLIAANRVNDICEEKNGTLWCSTDNGLYRVNGEHAVRIPVTMKRTNEIGQVMIVDEDHLWFSYAFGIFSVTLSTLQARELLDTEMSGTNEHIIPLTEQQNFAVVTSRFLYRYRSGTFTREVTFPKGSSANGTRDGSGNLWIGNTKCVYQVKETGGRFSIVNSFDVQSGLPVNDVSCVIRDREDNLWFGTAGKGIVRLQDPENFRFPFADLTSRGSSDPSGRIWVPTAGALNVVEQRKDHSWSISRLPFPPKNFPSAIQCISHDTLWCTTIQGGLTEFLMRTNSNGTPSLRTIGSVGPKNGLPVLYPVVLFKDSKGFLWCAKDKQGVAVVLIRGRARVEHVFARFPGVEPMTISSFCETPDGRVFAGGNGSNALLEFEYRDGTYHFLKAHKYDSLITAYGIRSLTVTPDGSVWIGTRYNGLLRRSPDGGVRCFTYDDGLHSMQILSLYSHGKELWIGTQSGMEFVPDVSAPRFFLSTELTRRPIYTIGKYNDRTIWAMSRYELTLNDTRSTEMPKFIPPVVISRFEVNGISQSIGTTPEIPKSGLVSCSIAYACVTLKGNVDVKYQYQLEGLHSAWQPLTRERSVTFANLGAGTYIFRVRAVLNNGEQVTESVDQSFVMIPPLWERWWFTPLIVSILLSLAAGVDVLRVRQRFALEKIRVSIAADLHDDIGSVLARIANLADIMVVYGSKKRITAAKKKNSRRSLPEGNAQTIADLSRELMEKMSDVVWSVNPDNDDPKKLTERLQTYSTEMAEHHRLHVNFTADGVFDGRSIDPQKTRAALLIVKEALANILEHSEAEKIDLSVQIMPKRWSITIADDGVGFNEDELPRVNGIYNMRSRAAACGGDVQVTSSAGKGTIIRLEIPL